MVGWGSRAASAASIAAALASGRKRGGQQRVAGARRCRAVQKRKAVAGGADEVERPSGGCSVEGPRGRELGPPEATGALERAKQAGMVVSRLQRHRKAERGLDLALQSRLTHTLETQAILRWTRCPRQIIYTRNSSFT